MESTYLKNTRYSENLPTKNSSHPAHSHNTRQLPDTLKADKEYRIGKILSLGHYCTRREAASFLEKNTIIYTPTQTRITRLNFKTTIENITKNFTINNKKVIVNLKNQVYLFNKPPGFICSHKSYKDQPSIFTLLPPHFSNLYFAGRLDKDSQGLVVLSNNGDLIYFLTHPKHRIEKQYIIHTNKPLSSIESQTTTKGISDEGDFLHFNYIKQNQNIKNQYTITLLHGKKREIRRMMKRFNIEVELLKRVQLGAYKLENLPQGKYLQK